METNKQNEEDGTQELEGDTDESTNRKRARLEIPGSDAVGKIQESDEEMEVAGNFFNL